MLNVDGASLIRLGFLLSSSFFFLSFQFQLNCRQFEYDTLAETPQS